MKLALIVHLESSQASLDSKPIFSLIERSAKIFARSDVKAKNRPGVEASWGQASGPVRHIAIYSSCIVSGEVSCFNVRSVSMASPVRIGSSEYVAAVPALSEDTSKTFLQLISYMELLVRSPKFNEPKNCH